METYDVVVVGAGLSGLSAAVALSVDRNIKLAMVEAKAIGSNNPSPLTFSEVTESFGLADCLKAQYSSFGYHNFRGSVVRYHFDGTPLVVLDYEKACHKLMERVSEKAPGLEFYNQKVTQIDRENEYVCVRLGSECTIGAKVLIDCSGRSMVAHRMLGNSASGLQSNVYGGCFSLKDEIAEETAWFLWPNADFGTGGGWFYPLDENRISFGYASISDCGNSNHSSLRDGLRRAMSDFEPYSTYLRNAELDYVEAGSIPVSYVERRVYPRILIAGDAAGMATNWTCMGVEPALRYGKLAGQTALRAVTSGDLNCLNNFQKVWDEENKETHDGFARLSREFWNADFDTFEWIIKNDLALLTPSQNVARMRQNDHVPTKFRFLLRALRFKYQSLRDKDALTPKTIEVRQHL